MTNKTYKVAGFYVPVNWDDIDQWIKENVGEQNCVWDLNHGDWGFHPDPLEWPTLREFEFTKATDAALFELAWPSQPWPQ